MWLRMLVAGHNIHLLADELTAFRIRDNNANMSAPRPDSALRHGFELTKVLTRLMEMSAGQFEDMFGKEAAKPPQPTRRSPCALPSLPSRTRQSSIRISRWSPSTSLPAAQTNLPA